MTRSNFCLTLVAGCFAVGFGPAAESRAQQPQVQYAAVLTVKNMCCAKESVPAIRELSKVPGVGRIGVDYKTRTLTIQPTDTPASPRAIWEAAERVQIVPLRLATPEGVYTTKPRR
jgi:copper chaperone CopZ